MADRIINAAPAAANHDFTITPPSSIALVHNQPPHAFDPLAYLERKGLKDFGHIKSITNINTIYDDYYESFCLQYPLVDVKNRVCGFERIYPDGILHGRQPGKFAPGQNKKLVKGSKPRAGFAIVGIGVSDLPTHFGKLHITGGMADAISCFISTGIPAICVVGENNAGNIARAIAKAFPHLKKNLISCLDHDKAGVHAAMRSGIQWRIPEREGDDWNDVFVREGAAALAAQLQGESRTPVPAFTLDDMFNMTRNQYIESCGNIMNARKFLNVSLSTGKEIDATPEDFAANALTFIKQFCHKVPCELSRDQLLEILLNDCLLSLHPDTLKSLGQYIDWRERKLRKTIFDATAITLSHIKELAGNYKSVKSIRPSTIPFEPGCIIGIKGPYGSGKSTCIRAFINAKKQDPKARILDINANRSLTLDSANQKDLASYLEAIPETASQLMYLASTVHSINKPQVVPFYQTPDGKTRKDLRLLIIDEITQVLSAIAIGFGMTNPKSGLYKLIQLIIDVIRQDGTVILADADLSTHHIKLLQSLLPDDVSDAFKIYEKLPEPTDITVYQGTGMKASNAMTNSLQKRVKRMHKTGEVIGIITDNKAQTKELDEYVKTTNPQLATKVICLNADNSGEPAQRRFLGNSNEEAKNYQVMIYSPIITSGLSIHSVQPTCIYAFYHGIVSPFSFMQQLFRFRKNKLIYLATDIHPVPIGCEDWGNRIDALEHLNNFGKPAHEIEYCDGFDMFCQKTRACSDRVRRLGGTGLRYLLEQQAVNVQPLSDVLDIGADYSEIAKKMAEIRKKQRGELPNKILDAPIIRNEEEYHKISGNPYKTLQNSLSCQRYEIGKGLGINDNDLTINDINFVLKIGIASLKRYSLLRGIDPKPDKPEAALSNRKFEEPLQQHLLFFMESIMKEDGSFKNEWGASEAKEVVNRLLAIEQEEPMTMVSQGLVPNSMIRGHGQYQKVVRPKSSRGETYYLNDFLLRRRFGLKTRAFQKTINGKKEWRYSIDKESLLTMEYYCQQRAAARGLKIKARTKGNIINTSGTGQKPESFSQWYQRRWRRRAGKQPPKIDPEVEKFLAELRDDPKPNEILSPPDSS